MDLLENRHLVHEFKRSCFVICDCWILIRFGRVRLSFELQKSRVFEKRSNYFRSVPCRLGEFAV